MTTKQEGDASVQGVAGALREIIEICGTNAKCTEPERSIARIAERALATESHAPQGASEGT